MSDDHDPDYPTLPEATAASDLVNGAVMAALMQALINKGLFTANEVGEIYEMALTFIEEQQAAGEGESPIFDMARELIERHLR